MNKIRNVSLLAVAVSMAISGQVNAQRTTSAQIEEVVVTAQKREENMQDVAISMSAMDANMIQKTFSRTIDEITGMSPNLIINPILGIHPVLKLFDFNLVKRQPKDTSKIDFTQ